MLSLRCIPELSYRKRNIGNLPGTSGHPRLLVPRGIGLAIGLTQAGDEVLNRAPDDDQAMLDACMQRGHTSASEHQRWAGSANGLVACMQHQLHLAENGHGHGHLANGSHSGLCSDLGSDTPSEDPCILATGSLPQSAFI